MCYIKYRPAFDEYELSSPGPRPLPRIVWAVPVDIVELGASLEAYSNLSPQITVLRLGHRFSTAALSRLPQEILDLVINHVHESESATNRVKWAGKYACFQETCNDVQHLTPYDEHTEATWRRLFVDHSGCCRPGRKLRSENFTHDQKISMIEEAMSGDHEYDEEHLWDIHVERQDEWVQRLCLCKEETTTGDDKRDFRHLQSNRFGMEAVVLHEALSFQLQSFLPGYRGDISYCTSCFLTLVSPKLGGLSPQDRTASQVNGQFLEADNHLAFYQRLGLTQLNINEEEQMRFSRTLRMLNLQPRFHLSELEREIRPSNKDKLLWEICDVQLKDCPTPNSKTTHWKKKKLGQYLQQKSEEVAKGSWPQLMHIATSDVVGPTTG